MPLYDFRCATCGTVFEASAAPGGTAPCTECGSADVARVWGSFATMSIGLRGLEAKRSNDTRRIRNEQHDARVTDQKAMRARGEDPLTKYPRKKKKPA